MKANSVVIDTNVLFSSVLSPQGIPAKVVRHFIQYGSILFSQETYEEFHSRLWRPKFDSYISIENRKAILLDFSNIAQWVEISGEFKCSRDPDDDKFIEVAIKANADMLISGDSDLTDIGSVDNIPIYTPNQCLSLINNQTR